MHQNCVSVTISEHKVLLAPSLIQSLFLLRLSPWCQCLLNIKQKNHTKSQPTAVFGQLPVEIYKGLMMCNLIHQQFIACQWSSAKTLRVHPVVGEKAACVTVSLTPVHCQTYRCHVTCCWSSCTLTAGISLTECHEDYCSWLWKWSCLGTLNTNILL